MKEDYKFIKVCPTCKKKFGSDYSLRAHTICIDCERAEKKLKKLEKLQLKNEN